MIQEKLSIKKRYLDQFFDLVNQLSPENLSCDGEISNAEAQRKSGKLMKAWKRLERQVGRTVSEEEVWGLFFTRQIFTEEHR